MGINPLGVEIPCRKYSRWTILIGLFIGKTKQVSKQEVGKLALDGGLLVPNNARLRWIFRHIGMYIPIAISVTDLTMRSVVTERCYLMSVDRYSTVHTPPTTGSYPCPEPQAAHIRAFGWLNTWIQRPRLLPFDKKL